MAIYWGKISTEVFEPTLINRIREHGETLHLEGRTVTWQSPGFEAETRATAANALRRKFKSQLVSAGIPQVAAKVLELASRVVSLEELEGAGPL